MTPAEHPASGAIRLEVRFFASLIERTGVSVESFDLPPGTCVADLWSLLEERHPALRSLQYRPLVACDLTYADWDAALDGVAEVAFLPPLSGG